MEKSGAAADFSGKRILVVEDNDINREIAVTLLEGWGFMTEEAVNGKEAVEKFLDAPPHYYDGILMDIKMPVMDGLQATRFIRMSEKEDSVSIPIIAMSANAFSEDMKKSMESGMNGHLVKPIEVEKTRKLLEKCIK
ncbi:MAG: response regulator [Eisenbergiella massiliensis]